MEMQDETSQGLSDNGRDLFMIAKVLSRIIAFVDPEKEPECVNVTKMLLNILRKREPDIIQ